MRQARAGAVADTIAQFVSSFATCEDCAAADALLKEGGGRATPAAARSTARHRAVLWVWEQHNALSATLAARTAPSTGASASHEACVLNVTANAGADIVQLSQLRLYGARGLPLEVGAARSPEWCHSAEPEGADMVLDSSLTTKWLCRADHAELQLTLAAPAAVTGYEMWTANDVPNRDPLQWELRCGTKLGGAAAGGAAGAAKWLLHKGTAAKRAFGEAAPRKQSMGRVDIVPQRSRVETTGSEATLGPHTCRSAPPRPARPSPARDSESLRRAAPRQASPPARLSSGGVAGWHCPPAMHHAMHYTKQAASPARVCQGGVAESRGVSGVPRTVAPTRAAGRRCRRQRRGLRGLVPAP